MLQGVDSSDFGVDKPDIISQLVNWRMGQLIYKRGEEIEK